MADAHSLRTAPHCWIADGSYAAGDGTAWRWYIEALPDLPTPILHQTVQGWCSGGAELVTERAEVAGACQATACAAIDRLIAKRAIKAGRKAARAAG